MVIMLNLTPQEKLDIQRYLAVRPQQGCPIIKACQAGGRGASPPSLQLGMNIAFNLNTLNRVEPEVL
jgi:hypothetical protein